MAEKKTTVIVNLSFDTNNDVTQELAIINRDVSKQSGGYKTKTELLSELIEHHYELLREQKNGG